MGTIQVRQYIVEKVTAETGPRKDAERLRGMIWLVT